jgi:hypothetical protein
MHTCLSMYLTFPFKWPPSCATYHQYTFLKVLLIASLSLPRSYWNVHSYDYVGSLDLRRRTFWTMNLTRWPRTLVMLIQTVLLCSRMTQMTSLAGAPILRWDCQPIRKMRWMYYGLGIWLLKIIRSPLRYELIDLWIMITVGPNDNGMYINCDWLYQFEIYFTGLVITSQQ